MVALNHKLLTSNKRIGKTQLDASWGISSHPIQVLWYTYTRPFREVYYIKVDESLNESLKIEGLGAQWEKVSWEDLESIFHKVMQ